MTDACRVNFGKCLERFKVNRTIEADPKLGDALFSSMLVLAKNEIQRTALE